MKFALSLLCAAFVGAPALAADGEAQLKRECAAQHKVAAKPGEHTFAYHRGKFRGEAQPGKALACSEAQYGQYLASVDPARLMALNPTAAGKSAEEHVFSYKKGKLSAP